MVYLAFLVGDNRVQIFQTLSGPYSVTVHNVEPKLLMYSKKMEEIEDEITKLVGLREKTRVHNLGFGGKSYVMDLDYDEYRILENSLVRAPNVSNAILRSDSEITNPNPSLRFTPRKGWIMIFKSRSKTIKGPEIFAAINSFTSNV